MSKCCAPSCFFMVFKLTQGQPAVNKSFCQLLAVAVNSDTPSLSTARYRQTKARLPSRASKSARPLNDVDRLALIFHRAAAESADVSGRIESPNAGPVISANWFSSNFEWRNDVWQVREKRWRRKQITMNCRTDWSRNLATECVSACCDTICDRTSVYAREVTLLRSPRRGGCGIPKVPLQVSLRPPTLKISCAEALSATYLGLSWKSPPLSSGLWWVMEHLLKSGSESTKPKDARMLFI